MYIKWPDGDEIRRELSRDRRYWNEVYKQKRDNMCPDTKRLLDINICHSCDFFMREKDSKVFCAITNGGWLQIKNQGGETNA